MSKNLCDWCGEKCDCVDCCKCVHYKARDDCKCDCHDDDDKLTEDEPIKMEEWVMNDVYEGLLKMPLWVLSAFGSLNDGDKLRTGDVRLELIIWLVVQSMNKCPSQFYDNDYRHEWKTAPYIPLVKRAVKSARESLKK